MSNIIFTCSHCKQSLEAPADMLGQLIDCPSCQHSIEIRKETISPLVSPPAPESATSAGTRIKQQATNPLPRPSIENNKQNFSSSGRKKLMWAGISILILVIAIIGYIYIQKKEIHGSAFIVTRGNDNIKIGLMQLHVYNSNDVTAVTKPCIEKYHAAAKERLERLVQEQLSELTQKVKEGKSLTTEQQEIIEYIRETEDPKAVFALIDIENIQSGMSSLQDAILTEIFERLSNSTPISKCKTDADGRFKLQVPKSGTYVLAAQNTRLVGDNTENYYWLLSLDTVLDNEQLFLSNDNLLAGSSGIDFDASAIFPNLE